MWKVFIESVTILLLFSFWFLCHEGPGILAPRSGIKPAAPALGGEVLTTGLLDKFPELFLNANISFTMGLKNHMDH